RLIRKADELVVFSDDSAAKIVDVWPDCRDALRVRPHQLLYQVPRVTPVDAKGRRPVIGVLGNIGHQKGAGVLVDLTKTLSEDGRANLVLIGNIDPRFKLVPPAQVHGDYQLRDIPNLVARYHVTCWLIPSIWPETFSYTTREVLATGLPVWCFDLGAQAEAVKQAVAEGAPGGVIPLANGRSPVADVVDRILKLPLYEGA
ncbi:MAG: glycosyltransferase, partial [Paracoccaceae bacterium]